MGLKWTFPEFELIQKRQDDLKNLFKTNYLDKIDDYFEAKDTFLRDINLSIKDMSPFCYKNVIENALKKSDKNGI